ncbi:MAG: hypothetical protein V7L26_02710, partial [Nostoc sp.]
TPRRSYVFGLISITAWWSEAPPIFCASCVSPEVVSCFTTNTNFIYQGIEMYALTTDSLY